MKCIIFDIDGTLADVGHRRHFVSGPKKDYDAFFEAMVDDPPIASVCELAETLCAHAHTEFNLSGDEPYAVFVCSGRPDNYRTHTNEWLSQHTPNLRREYMALLMRPAGDYRPDTEIKKEMLSNIRGQGFEPMLVVDDRQRVVDMWRREGITCLQCDASDWDKGPTHGGAPGTLHLLVGPSGAGKSTYAAATFGLGGRLSSFNGVLSSDSLRLELCDDIRDQSKNDQVFAAIHDIAEARIKNGLGTVIDATNIRDRDRRSIRDRMPASCEIVYHVIDRPLADKHRDAGWRAGVTLRNGVSLIDGHAQTFRSNLKNILAGDNDPRVTVKDMRAC